MAVHSSRMFLAAVVTGVLLVSGPAIAQDAPAPIDVPSTPVALDPAPIVPGAARPKPEAPPRPAPTPAAESKTPAKDEKSTEKADKGDKIEKKAKINNEGYFKVSGGKSTWVGGSGPTTKGGKGAPVATKVGKTTAAKKTPITVAQWAGFQLTSDGGSEVMLEFTTNISPPTEHHAAGTLTYVFRGAHVIKHNNQNPLITVHWNTPVASIRLVPKVGEVHLVIELRAGISASPSTGIRAGGDGDGQQFFAKFGAGSYLPVAADTDEAPAPKKVKATGKSAPTKPKGTSTAAGPKE